MKNQAIVRLVSAKTSGRKGPDGSVVAESAIAAALLMHAAMNRGLAQSMLSLSPAN